MILEEKARRSQSLSHYEEAEDESSGKRCSDKIAPYMLNPQSRTILVWNEIVGAFYIIAFFLDPMIVVFAFQLL